MQQPELKKKNIISPIWFLPFLALCIGGWLLYTSYRDAGIDITIHFENANGITPGKTKVIYKGIPVGTVKKVGINRELNGVDLLVEMDKKTKPGLVEDTKFWIVRPEISAGKISGLDTLVTGSYIGAKPGISSVPATEFIGLLEPPPLNRETPGLHITLTSPVLHSLQRGSNIYSKNIQIGQVEDYQLGKDGIITLQVFIKPEFAHLVRKDTRFWNSSGLSISGNLQTGVSFNVESLASLIYGGISCATPRELSDSPAAESGMTFPLYKDFEEARYGIPMTLRLDSGEGIVAGKTKVMFRGIKAGVVTKIDINRNHFHPVTATILLDPRAEDILKKNTRFWVLRPQVSIDGIKNLETLLTGIYITFQPGDGPYQDNFIVSPDPVPLLISRRGTHFLLTSQDSGSLKTGAPVLFRKITVGKISNISLAEDGETVNTEILVYSPYDRLVHKNSIFWNVSGITVDGSLSNFSVNLSTLRTMIAGGITFFSPGTGTEEDRKPAEANTVFSLYESYQDAASNEPALQPKGLSLRIRTDSSPQVSVGSPLLYNGIKVGQILDLSLDGRPPRTTIDLLVYEKYRYLINGSTRFFSQSGIEMEASLQGINLETIPLEALLSGGIGILNPKQSTPLEPDRVFSLYHNRKAAENADKLHLTLRLHNARGINKQTKIRYQGIKIGSITSLRFSHDLDMVIADAVVDNNTKKLFRKDSVLFLVGPKVGLSGISHPETILTGTYITLRPGKGEPAHDFTVLSEAPGRDEQYAGLNLILESPSLGSLKPGKPVYYRKVPVGLVTGYELAPAGNAVWISVNIHPEYEYLVRKGTRFWNASGFEIEGGVFSGMTVKTESLEALVAGGVAFATPEGEEMGEPAVAGDHFQLAAKADKTWKDWAPELRVVEEKADIAESSRQEIQSDTDDTTTPVPLLKNGKKHPVIPLGEENELL